MRWVALFLLPYFSIFLETTLFSRYSLQGIVPDLVLIFVTFYAIDNGAMPGMKYGFLCGLFEDLYMGRFIGMNALAKGITAWVVGRFEVDVFKQNILVGFGSVFLGTVVNAILLFLLGMFAFPHFVVDKSIFLNLSGQVVYNSLLSIPFYVWYYRTARSEVFNE